MRTIVIFAAIASLTAGLAPQTAIADGHEKQKAILVTGASTGIGRHLAEALAAEGHFVYAGARKDKDLAELNAIDNIKAVRLDVTKQDQVDAAVELIRSEGRGLYGLVNNAGVGGGGPVVDTPISELTFVLGVNVEGVWRTTQAFAPLIIEEKGRITTTGSIAGILSGAGWGPYSASKHAMEAFADALVEEMAPHGVAVSIVEPGSYKSNIRRSSHARRLDQIEAATGEVTADQKEEYEKTAQRELSYQEPVAVTEAFMHALFADEPKRRYMVVPTEEQARATIGQQIKELVELNEWHAYSYDRDELVQMLDEALAAQ